MNISEFSYKLKGKIHHYLVTSHRGKPFEKYFSHYKSYRHPLTHNTINHGDINYFSARPNPGAGIGHQMANWIAGYWFAQKFGLKFAHIPFSNDNHPFVPDRWDVFLGFGEKEILVTDLIHQGYKKVLLPIFEENDEQQIEAIKKIIASYADKKVVFICEQDQFLKDQFLVMDDLKRKFRSAVSRQNDKIQYDESHFNIAVHVRRTVIIDGKTINESEEIRAKRWLANNYYEKVLKQVLDNIKINEPISIWLFSTGKPEEFADFAKYGDVHFCSDMNEYNSFTHLIFADLLITSKSSFSYKPALMNNGIKVCPRNFWHGYPDAKDWILCENDGTFDIEKLKEALEVVD